MAYDKGVTQRVNAVLDKAKQLDDRFTSDEKKINSLFHMGNKDAMHAMGYEDESV